MFSWLRGKGGDGEDAGGSVLLTERIERMDEKIKRLKREMENSTKNRQSVKWKIWIFFSLLEVVALVSLSYNLRRDPSLSSFGNVALSTLIFVIPLLGTFCYYVVYLWGYKGRQRAYEKRLDEMNKKLDVLLEELIHDPELERRNNILKRYGRLEEYKAKQRANEEHGSTFSLSAVSDECRVPLICSNCGANNGLVPFLDSYYSDIEFFCFNCQRKCNNKKLMDFINLSETNES